jgi:hypothetical protein
MIRKLLLLLALIASAPPLCAQEPSPGQLRAAEPLIEAMHVVACTC